MITIRVLLENTTVSPHLTKAHGLSLVIETRGGAVLLDLGPNTFFVRNAHTLGVDLASIKAVVLSHAHRDHVGGLDAFCQANALAPVYLLDSIEHRYWAKLVGPFRVPVGLRASGASRARITELSGEHLVMEGVTFLPITVHSHDKPRANRSLWKTVGNALSRDDFRHEGVLVVDDADELVIFNSCSHNGVLNTIETVQRRFPGKRIRAYVGGLHLTDPVTGRRETDASLEALAQAITEHQIRVFTGHCTGERCFRFLSTRAPQNFYPLSTGFVGQV